MLEYAGEAAAHPANPHCVPPRKTSYPLAFHHSLVGCRPDCFFRTDIRVNVFGCVVSKNELKGGQYVRTKV